MLPYKYNASRLYSLKFSPLYLLIYVKHIFLCKTLFFPILGVYRKNASVPGGQGEKNLLCTNELQ